MAKINMQEHEIVVMVIPSIVSVTVRLLLIHLTYSFMHKHDFTGFTVCFSCLIDWSCTHEM